MSKGQILYIGNLREGGNGQDRIEVLRSQGYDTEGFDTRPFRSAGPRLLRSLTARGWGPAVLVLNRELDRLAKRGGFDVVMVDKGTVIGPATLTRLKTASRRQIAVHYTPDAAFSDNGARNFFQAVPNYDLLVTTKPFEMDDYRRAGARELLLIHQGFGPRIDPALARNVPETLRSKVVFVGHCQPHYARLLRAVAQVAPLAIWGPGWPEYAARHDWARAVVRGPGLYGDDYARAIGGAQIALGLLSKRVPETTTTRSFEIPAMGTMLLAERTPDHQALFAEDREAAYFDGATELQAQLNRYLNDAPARQRIAAAGQAKCFGAGYATADQFARITEWLDSALSSASSVQGHTPR